MAVFPMLQLYVILILIFWEMLETLVSFYMEIYYHLPHKQTGKVNYIRECSISHKLLPDYDVYMDIKNQ